jgi:hypothetical protein
MRHLVDVEVLLMLMVSANIGDDRSLSEVSRGSSAMCQDTCRVD